MMERAAPSLDAFRALEARVTFVEQRLAAAPAEARERPVGPVAAIIADAADAMGLDPRAISSRQSEEWLHRARFAVAWTAREALNLQLMSIARPLGRSDHTTIRHQINRAGQLRAKDRAFRNLTDRLLAAAEQRRDAR